MRWIGAGFPNAFFLCENSIDNKKRKVEEKMQSRNYLAIIFICLAIILLCLSGCDPDDKFFDLLPDEYPQGLLKRNGEEDTSMNIKLDAPPHVPVAIV